LGEYGTAYSTHSADDIIGRLCDDVAESHAGDITVKITKLWNFFRVMQSQPSPRFVHLRSVQTDKCI
jgi:hypothetical protein